ncbi:MAG: hypothetical protein HYY95_28115 [Candidatus Rokubacteria bacterium]|nr:hypothetical protein [Candidatus Rokubacteria bacterium]MBI3109394.1 hypothetical protein [Candidatus Rokubacteria bacterium]
MAQGIAIYQDAAIGEPPWAERLGEYLAAQGVDVIPVRRPDGQAFGALRKADGFMWRFTHGPASQGIAKPFLSAVEHALPIPVWPNFATRWHYDDKIAQAWLLELAGAPLPETAIFDDAGDALAWSAKAGYPLVFKLRGGASSQSVCLVESPAAAARLIGRVFDRGLTGHHDLAAIARGDVGPLWKRSRGLPGDVARVVARRLRYGRAHLLEPSVPVLWPMESTAVLFQEYLPGNEFDYRVTVIGDRAFGFRRFNRPGDFRASGSGRIDADPSQVGLDAVQLAFDISGRLRFQSMAYDFVRDREGRVRLLEISYTFVGRAVAQCPGHWDRDLRWHPGQLRPEDAIAEDFLEEVRRLRHDVARGR